MTTTASTVTMSTTLSHTRTRRPSLITSNQSTGTSRCIQEIYGAEGLGISHRGGDHIDGSMIFVGKWGLWFVHVCINKTCFVDSFVYRLNVFKFTLPTYFHESKIFVIYLVGNYCRLQWKSSKFDSTVCWQLVMSCKLHAVIDVPSMLHAMETCQLWNIPCSGSHNLLAAPDLVYCPFIEASLADRSSSFVLQVTVAYRRYAPCRTFPEVPGSRKNREVQKWVRQNHISGGDLVKVSIFFVFEMPRG